MPAPAVIPAPRAYIKVAAVKTPVALGVVGTRWSALFGIWLLVPTIFLVVTFLVLVDQEIGAIILL